MASKILADKERKIDSISNVLEDIGVLKFTSEDNVQWIGLEGSKLAKEIQRDLKQYLASMLLSSSTDFRLSFGAEQRPHVAEMLNSSLSDV